VGRRAGERLDRALGRRVGGESGADRRPRELGGEVDDAAVPRGQHRAQGVLGTEERPGHVDGEHPAVVRDRHVEKWAARHHAGVVHQHVEPAEARQHPRDHRAHLVLVRDVGPHRLRASTGRCLPLRAFENRVYEVELEDERRLVVKFYRPGRWSRETILDEHRFLADLAAAEIPAVAPLDLGTGTTLGEIEGIYYAAFPKIRGRTLDELDAENRRRIGRTIGRMHAVGAARDAPHRLRLDATTYIREPVEVLLKGSFIPESLAPRYRDVALSIAERA